MSIKCRRPLLSVCGEVSRIKIAMGECRACPVDAVSLRIERAGCVESVEKCVEEVIAVGCFCGDPVEFTSTRIVREDIPKIGVTYPAFEVNTNGEVVFVLDNKFADMGTGRYTGVISFGSCGTKCIDIDYSCGDMTITGISAHNSEGC